MVTPEKLHVSGPKKRKTLRSVRRNSLDVDDDIMALLDECSYEKQTFTISRESSVNRSHASCEWEDLTDSDDSLSDAYTDDMEPIVEEEKSTTPVDATSMKHSSDESRRIPLTLERSALGRKYDRPEPQPINPETTGNGFISMLIVVGIICALLAIYCTRKVTTQSATCESFFALEERYTTVDENLWDMLNTTVRRATATDDECQPGTILFLHYGPTSILDGLIKSVSRVTASCLGGSLPITLDAKYFKQPDFQQDYGMILSQLKKALLRHGVMVVGNFQDVPARAAQAFHTICDTEEPLVKRAVIYITLDMLKAADVSKPPSGKSATAEAEQLLHELWKDILDPAVLDPLIIRLTENVYRIV